MFIHQKSNEEHLKDLANSLDKFNKQKNMTDLNKKLIQARIDELKTQLTGKLLLDGELQDEIYKLKLQLNPEIANNPNLDTDECLYCGS